jgi:hypothetical protein
MFDHWEEDDATLPTCLGAFDDQEAPHMSSKEHNASHSLLHITHVPTTFTFLIIFIFIKKKTKSPLIRIDYS